MSRLICTNVDQGRLEPKAFEFRYLPVAVVFQDLLIKILPVCIEQQYDIINRIGERLQVGSSVKRKRRKENDMMPNPFIYLGHGTSYYKEAFDCLIWFQKNSAAAALAALKEIPLFVSDIPFDLDQAGDAVGLIHVQENYEYEIKAYADGEFRKMIKARPEDTNVWSEENRFLPNAAEWQRFNDEFDAALIKIHESRPILFVIKAVTPGKKYGAFSEWHDASLGAFNEKAWPVLEAFFAGNQKNGVKPELVERFNTLINTVVSMYLKKYNSKKDRQKSNLAMVDFLCKHHIVYHDEEYNLFFKWMEYEKHVFAFGELLEKMLPKNESAVPILQSLSPYTQLVCFSGADYPFLLHFDSPAEYLKNLLGKIDKEKDDVLSEYLTLVNNRIYEWFYDGNAPLQRELMDAISDLVLSCNPVVTSAYRDVLNRWETFGEWNKLLTHMTTSQFIDQYLLGHEKPAEFLKELLKEIPREYRTELPAILNAIAGVLLKTRTDEKKHGWKHNMAAVAKAVTELNR